ncbi:type II toxin-antitoxin system RelE/ParE family toxin [Xanthobacter oligotrophicus]|uniref:type II toxin-antitoxin system RelE/ParE family toxin n=1 Tax=Xanthobacter oligotrophicus TaxID=2607286 RepID=UPI0011F230C1|nr:type II toxin-antitoxin system RelE/ParE family toxin [Xanthobacter oligotrophicus]MCG5235711.1 type II toxin-antitoxin system RelE/ParE family toxin [Xanthobacter oligotrophicus]
MAHELRYSRRALDDLDAIFTHITRDSPNGAATVVRRIQNAVDALRDFPSSGRPTARKDIRLLTVSGLPFRIFYLLRPKMVIVLHVRHTARRPL